MITASEARAILDQYDIRSSPLADYVDQRVRTSVAMGKSSVTIQANEYPESIPREHIVAGITLLATPENQGGYGYQVVTNDDGSVTITVP